MTEVTRLSFPFPRLAAPLGVGPLVACLGSGQDEWAQAQRQKVGTSPAPKGGADKHTRRMAVATVKPKLSSGT